jgi:hypothetical protein
MGVSNERAEMIRRVWSEIRDKVDFRHSSVLLAHEPVEVMSPWYDTADVECVVTLKTLEFRHESSSRHGRVNHRVVCEGVPVERWDEDARRA